MKKQFLFSALFFFGAGALTWAADFESGGLYFNKLSDTTVEVTYPTGAEQYDQYDNPKAYGSEYAGDIVIPSTIEVDKVTYTVVKIGNNAFRGAFTGSSALVSVSIPETVTEIGESAFMYRSTLTTVNIPSALELLGDYAFLNCSSLKSRLVIPGTVKNTGFQTFYGCGKLEYLKLEDGIEVIGKDCFTYCRWLEYSEEVDGNKIRFTTVPSSVREIGSGAFNNCEYIHEFVVPEGVVWNDAMSWCGFDGCKSLEKCVLSNGIESIGTYCFRKTKISEFTIPAGTKSVSNNAFVDCGNLVKIVVEPSAEPLSYVMGTTFSNATKLQSLHLGREISPFCFSNQDALTDVTITTDKVLETPVFPDAVYENATLTVPVGMVETYRAHAQWGKFKTIVDGTEPVQPWLEDVTFNCVAEDGVIYVAPRRIAGLYPQFTPADAATWSNVTYEISNAGTTKEDRIASLYTVNYWKPERIKFPELQGYRPGECKLTVTVANPNNSEEKFIKEFTVKVVEDPIDAGENGYVDGTIILNEEWFGHTNGSINYITPDNEILYQAYSRENPGYSFGCTSQYGTIWAGKLIVASKQAADGGDPLPGGGRLVIADARTLKRLGSLDVLEWDGQSGDGRAVAGATPDKVYVSSSNGIFVVDITDPTAPVVTGRISAGGDTEAADLYNGQVGDMITTAGHVFAVKQNFGVIVIDVDTDAIVKTIADANVQGITQTADGRVWYATVENNCAKFVDIDSETLEAGEGRTMPESVGKVTCGWGAWRSTSFKGNSVDNRILFVSGSAGIMGGPTGSYYLYDVDSDPAALQPLFTMSEQKGVTDFGEEVNLMNYGTPLLDVRHNRIVALAGRKGASSGGYRDHWILFVDAATGEVTNNFKLEPYYWFQSLPIFPDKYDVDFVESFTGMEVEKDVPAVFDLREFVTDTDNIDANIRFYAADEVAASTDIASFSLEGSKLTVTPTAGGSTNYIVTAESNGRAVALSLPVVVRVNTGISSADATCGSVRVSGNRIYIDGCAGEDFALYNAAGACVAVFTADSDAFVAEFDLASGVYVLRGREVAVKVAVK